MQKARILPNFIGIGAPKSGTTWLFKCLQEHPEVYIPSAKELNFLNYLTIDGRWGEYEQYFADVTPGQYKAIGEISTRYLDSPRAPQRVKEYIPEARLFVSLRNPIDQVYSYYWHLSSQNFHQWDSSKIPQSFEQALEEYKEKLLPPASYYEHIKNWLSYFDNSQLHIILFDDISSDPHNVFRELCKFLQIDSSFVPPSIQTRNASVRAGVSPKNAASKQTHKVVYDFLNKQVYHKMKDAIGVQNAVKLKDTLNVRYLMEKAFFRSGYPPMQASTRQQLQRYFASDIQGLEGLIGRSLQHWS